MKPIIKVENLSKQYRLGTIGTGTLRNDLKRWSHKIRGKEDPFLMIGETNDRSQKGDSEYVWALKDINFEVMPGEIMGIIGKNGAGKSTLLKILSKVTGPTTGRIDYDGRIGSLLEVGTGFHPELTGRENIFLNGAILGMTKAEIKAKLDEIIDFSGCERYIDTPVKRYSSGMMVRLGFAVAAHLEPEILVVDEVLAVGDAEFQKKAIGKMQDVSSKDGRTVLFVSHNMASIQQLCDKGILLRNGTVEFTDKIKNVIEHYQQDIVVQSDKDTSSRTDRKGNGSLKVVDCVVQNSNKREIETVIVGKKMFIVVTLERGEEFVQGRTLTITANISDPIGTRIFQMSTLYLSKQVQVGERHTRVQFEITKFPLSSGLYNIGFYIANEFEILDWIDNVKEFSVESGDFFDTGKITEGGIFFAEHNIEQLN